MSRRRFVAFAAPLVVTVALGPGCDKKESSPAAKPPPDAQMTRNPPMPQPDAAPTAQHPIRFDGFICLQGPEGKESSVPCPPELLPEAPKGTAVLQSGQECRTLGRKQVRCPPTIVAPATPHRQDGRVHLAFDEGTFGCSTWEEMSCPPGATCNPPPPQPIDCPPEMLPTLAPGVAPTAQKDGCFLGDVPVTCP
jgi:hypothetical protein